MTALRLSNTCAGRPCPRDSVRGMADKVVRDAGLLAAVLWTAGQGGERA